MLERITTISNRVTARLYGEDVNQADGRCRSAPEWLVLCINNFCNLKCRMCDVGTGERGSVFYANMIGLDPTSMSLELLRQTLAGAQAFRPRPKVGLAFTEPLNHPQIVEFVRQVKAQGFFCSMTSNGYLLPQRARGLVEAGLDALHISVDGPAEVHDRIRGRKTSFERLYQGIQELTAARDEWGRPGPRVHISFTLTDLNYTHLRECLAQLAPLDVDSLNVAHLSFVTPEMAAAHNARYDGEWAVAESCVGEMDLAGIDCVRLAQEIASVRRSKGGPRVTFHPDLETVEQLERYYRRPAEYIGGRRCTDPFKMMMVKTDGTVIPAHSRCYNYPLGRVSQTPLTDIWNNARFVGFRSRLSAAGGTLPACTRCCGVVGKPPLWGA